MEIALEVLRFYYASQAWREEASDVTRNVSHVGRNRWLSSRLTATFAGISSVSTSSGSPTYNTTTHATLSPLTSASHHVTTNLQAANNSLLPGPSSIANAPNQPVVSYSNYSLPNVNLAFPALSSSTSATPPARQSGFINPVYSAAALPSITILRQVNVSDSNDNLDYWTDVPMILNVKGVLSSSLDAANDSFQSSSLSLTNSSAAGNVGEADSEFNWWALIAIVFILAGLVGNVLVCLAVTTDRRLQTPTNYFLLSLAVADLFVSVLVMPLGMSVEIMGYWPFNLPTCVVYSFSDIFCCTASIMHMCMISIDRYMGISRPLTHRTRSVRFDIGMKILGVWLVSFAVSCPVIFVSVFHSETTVMLTTPEGRIQCNLDNYYIMIIGSVVAFFIPQLVMGIMMTKTLLLLRQQAKWSAGKRGATYQVPRLACKRSSTPAADALLADGKQLVVSRTARSDSQGTTVTVKSKSNGVTYTTTTQPDVASNSNDSPEDDPCSSGSPVRTPNAKNAGRIVAAINLLNRKNKQKKARQIDSEKKATTVLGLVFGIFCLCWTPFFIMNTVYALCGIIYADGCNISPAFFTFFLWLGWVSSTVNPMIYTVVNPNFRQAFIRLLSMGSMGQRCRGAVRVSVQNFRGGIQSEDPKAVIVVRRASKYPGMAGAVVDHRAITWSPTFLTALELNNETPV